MAGIGFELRKIFMDKTISGKIKGISYSVMIAVGPMLISILTLIIIRQLLRFSGAPQMESEVISISLMYAFIFALISAGSISMLLSRFIADQIYIHDLRSVMNALVEASVIVILIGSLLSLFFYLSSPLPLIFRLLSHLSLIELSIIYVFMVCLTALKNYKQITLAYLTGAVLTLVLVVISINRGFNLLITVPLSVNLGYLINMMLMLVIIRRHFPPIMRVKFVLPRKMRQMPRLVLIGLFYSAGIFSHSFVIWYSSPIAVQIAQTFYTSPYDIATFYAVLSIFPSSIVFIVKVETAFYERFTAYCQSLINGGDMHQISQTQNRLVSTLKQQLFQLFVIQLIISILVVIFSSIFGLPLLGASSYVIRLFIILSFGFYLTQMMYFIITILLYFDNQEDALTTSIIFLSLTIIFSYVTVKIGQSFYGLGFVSGAFISLIYSIFRLSRMMKSIDYRLFSKQPLEQTITMNDKKSHTRLRKILYRSNKMKD